jgi:hypothetical protein
MIAVVTAQGVAEIDIDQPILTAALAAAGVEHRTVCWDDPDVDWSSFRAAVIRSTWDYWRRADEFLAWAEHAGSATVLLNPIDVIRWNLDKRYLTDLAAAGIPTTPTLFLEPGDRLDDTLGRSGWDPAQQAAGLVVKPVVSAGSNDTVRHGHLPAAAAHVQALHDQGRTVMVQPYQAQIETLGETGNVFIDGRFSHSFRKGALLSDRATGAATRVAGLFVQEDIGPRSPTGPETAVADQVVDWIAERFGTLLYARVDLVPGADGPVVLELELVEPSLFFSVQPDAAPVFVEALTGRLDTTAR